MGQRGRKMIDHTGRRYGKLVVQQRLERRLYGNLFQPFWRCLCDCGKTREVPHQLLRNNLATSCGCTNKKRGPKLKNLVGQRFGKLVVQEYLGPRHREGKQTLHYWKCLCDCGDTKEVTSGLLTSGGVQSCGCLLGGERWAERWAELRQREVQVVARYEAGETCGDLANDLGVSRERICQILRKSSATIRPPEQRCGRRTDLTGQTFGRLTVQGRSARGSSWWDCLCSCGKTITLPTSHLIGKHKYHRASCGCARSGPRKPTPIGAVYNRWTVIGPGEKTGYWIVRCTCGTIRVTHRNNIVQNLSKSCGCWQRELLRARSGGPAPVCCPVDKAR